MNVNISELPSAWTGHYDFAQWLVEELKPTVTVDLGVDYGYSLFALAMPEIGKVYGVTRERIRQIESKTMSKLRHPSRSQVLRDYLD